MLYGVGLLLPQEFRADCRSWGQATAQSVFRDPPTERNRVWQTDFSEFETTSGGIGCISAVVDYATKYCLAITITRTSRGADAVACLNLAIAGVSGWRSDVDDASWKCFLWFESLSLRSCI